MELLNDKQTDVLRLVRQGKNVFFTGSAGTGKTFLLEQIVSELKKKYRNYAVFRRKVAITAPTGIAATNIGGQTLNAALGVGIPVVYADFLKNMTTYGGSARIRKWDTLIIDEASMLSAEFLNEVESAFRTVRSSDLPAGGIQLIFAGDFHQLPPVTRGVNLSTGTSRDVFLNFGYAFQCPAWRRLDMTCVELIDVYRQSDKEFVGLLNAIRSGTQEEASVAMATIGRRCSRPLEWDSGIKPTQVFSKNSDVDDMNAIELKRLVSEGLALHSVRATDSVKDLRLDPGTSKVSAPKTSDFFRDCMAGSTVDLCVGAQVMLLKNLKTEDGLVNGSRGVVVRFVPKSVISRSAMDLLSVWQGNVVPIVRFANGKEITILPAKFSSVMQSGRDKCYECSRIQIPLKLAWAITVHKSQGMSLDRVRVSLRSMFAVGQIYVALSRARSLEGLEVTGWQEVSMMRTDASVKDFYERMRSQEKDEEDDGAWTEWCQLRVRADGQLAN